MCRAEEVWALVGAVASKPSQQAPNYHRTMAGTIQGLSQATTNMYWAPANMTMDLMVLVAVMGMLLGAKWPP